jgi:hypothetical protein
MNPRYKLFITLSLSILLSLGLFHFFQWNSNLAWAATDESQVIQAGLAYIQSQQLPDGGITGFNGSSNPDTTARAMMAFSAAGSPLDEVLSPQGKSMLDYLTSQAITYTHDTTGTVFPGRAGIILTAVVLAGGDGTSFGGMDLVGELEASLQPATGAYSSTAMQGYSSGTASDVSQAWAILGLGLDGYAIPEVATNYLINSQSPDGSWGAGDPDTTALAVTALLASQNLSNEREPIQRAIGYFHATQADNAGWKPAWDSDPLNADSTGWILQALVSAGEDVLGQSWIKGQNSPVDALMGLQKPDGSIGGTYANAYTTAEAIIGMAGIPFTDLMNPPSVNRAGLAIFFANDTVSTACISFTESSINGLELLERSDLDIQTATNPNQGTVVCKIGQVGDSSADCFGSMPNYWAYWTLGPSGWEYSATGAEQSQVLDDSVHAWSWGSGAPPPTITFQNICEGVEYMLPTREPTSIPVTETPEPAANSIIAPALTIPTETVSPAAVIAPRLTTNYIIYGSIVIVLAVLILILIRSHNK